MNKNPDADNMYYVVPSKKEDKPKEKKLFGLIPGS